MSNCWDVNIPTRPDFDTICDMLEEELTYFDDSIVMTTDIRARNKKKDSTKKKHNTIDHQQLDVDTRLNHIAEQVNGGDVDIDDEEGDGTLRIHDKVID